MADKQCNPFIGYAKRISPTAFRLPMEMLDERLAKCLMTGQAGRLEFLEGRDGRLPVAAP
jgi:hypothetical protein